MKKIISSLVLLTCVLSVYSQAARDTVYIYETVTVYDTIVIRDTVRVSRLMNMPVVQPVIINGDIFVFPSEIILMPQENNPLQTSRSKKERFLSGRTSDANIISVSAATFSENDVIGTDNIKKNKNKTKEMKEIKKRKEVKEMKLNLLHYASVAILATHTYSGVSAQETAPAADEEPLPVMPVQFTVAYPITTMGAKTKDYCFNASFNLFSGMVGAVSGIEFGCFVNHAERDVTGVQFAGIGNSARHVTGVQFATVYNVSSSAKGAQLSGIANISENMNGIQYSGIANINKNVRGIQFAGIANLSETVEYGVQFAGIANVSREVKGIQFAGISNVSESVTGLQFGGIGNVSREVTGTQFAGIYNRTDTLRGFQFAGIINITDTIEKGASMALVNIVRRGGYRAWELSFADYMTVGLSFKMGTQKLYTIYSVGAALMKDKLWVAGIGFGNRTALSARIDFQPEIIGYQYFPNDFKNVINFNSTHLKLGFVFRMTDRLGVVVAPSIYWFNAEDKDESGDYYKVSPFKPFYTEKIKEQHFQVENEKFRIPPYITGIGAGVSVGLIWR